MGRLTFDELTPDDMPEPFHDDSGNRADAYRDSLEDLTNPRYAMPLPKILHRHGGEITAITHIGHSTHKGVAEWFFVGDIEWRDGTKSAGREISPVLVCYDDEVPGSHDRVTVLMAELNLYLSTAGTWHEPKHKRDGRVYNWTPREKEGRIEVPK